MSSKSASNETIFLSLSSSFLRSEVISYSWARTLASAPLPLYLPAFEIQLLPANFQFQLVSGPCFHLASFWQMLLVLVPHPVSFAIAFLVLCSHCARPPALTLLAPALLIHHFFARALACYLEKRHTFMIQYPGTCKTQPLPYGATCICSNIPETASSVAG